MRGHIFLCCVLFACRSAPLTDESEPLNETPVSNEAKAEQQHNGEMPMGEAPPPIDVAESAETNVAANITLTPEGRLLLATGERVPLKVVDTEGRDVTAECTFDVRDPAAGSVFGGVFTAGSRGSVSSVITATYRGATSAPILVSIVAPVFAESFEHNQTYATSGAASEAYVASDGKLYVRAEGHIGQSFTVTLPFAVAKNLSKTERLRFSYVTSARGMVVEPGYSKASDGSYVAFNKRLTLDDEGDASFEFDASWLADSNNASALVIKGWLAADGLTEILLDDVAVLHQFVLGINMAWLDGAYAHDFGRSYHHPEWGVAYNKDHVEALLAMLQRMNVRLIRVWVFEGCEGLHKDGAQYTTGLDDTFLTSFDDFVFKRLPKYDVKVVFMLLGARHTVECSSPSPIADTRARNAFFDNAMLPFVARYQKSPWVWGFDLTNEAEGAVKGPTGNWETRGVEWTQMRSFLSEGAAKVRAVAPRAHISGSSGWHNHENVKAGRFSGLGFNYLDFHNYDDAGLVATYGSLGRAAKVVVGEIGQASQSRDEALQLRSIGTMLDKIYRGNYWGAWPWAVEYPGSNDEHALLKTSSTYSSLIPTPALEALDTFAHTHQDLGP